MKYRDFLKKTKINWNLQRERLGAQEHDSRSQDWPVFRDVREL